MADEEGNQVLEATDVEQKDGKSVQETVRFKLHKATYIAFQKMNRILNIKLEYFYARAGGRTGQVEGRTCGHGS